MTKKFFNMKKLFLSALVACTFTSCAVEVLPYTTGIYSSTYSYRAPIVTPIAHGFDPNPQYVRCGSWIFRNPNDGMLYSIR